METGVGWMRPEFLNNNNTTKCLEQTAFAAAELILQAELSLIREYEISWLSPSNSEERASLLMGQTTQSSGAGFNKAEKYQREKGFNS